MQSYLSTCSHLWLPDSETSAWNRAAGSGTEFVIGGSVRKFRKLWWNSKNPKSGERSTNPGLFPCQTQMEVGKSSCGNDGVWMNRYLLVYLLHVWLRVLIVLQTCGAHSWLELFLSAAISCGGVLLFRETAGCQGFQLAFGEYMTFLWASSKI